MSDLVRNPKDGFSHVTAHLNQDLQLENMLAWKFACSACLKKSLIQLTLKGSTLSQETGDPHDEGRTFSGSDSGTTTRINKTSNKATAAANHITKLSL